MTSDLVERARDTRYTAPDLRALAQSLPATGVEEALADAARARDAAAFTNLLLAAAEAGLKPSAAHLAVGLQLLPGCGTLVAVAPHLGGDLAAPLVEAVRKHHQEPLRAAAALLLAARDSVARGRRLPDGLRAAARQLARHARQASVLAYLLAIADILDDAELTQALWLIDADADRELVRRTVLEQLDAGFPSPLHFVPEQADAPPLAGYTVRRAVPRIGRNEPCPCGSGRKYKRCCEQRDRERLRESSDVAGVTWSEMYRDPARYLTPRRALDLPPHELVRALARPLDPALLRVVFNRLVRARELEALAAYVEREGLPAGLEGHLDDAIECAAGDGEAALVRRLLAARASADVGLWGYTPGVRLLLAADSGEATLELVETEAWPVVDAGAIDLAYGLLDHSPALGILVARGVLTQAIGLDAEVLLDALLEARDKLDLPVHDPIEPLVSERLGREDLDLEAEERAAAERPEVEALAGEAARLRQETARLRRELEQAQSEASRARREAERLAAAPETTGAPVTPPEPVSAELRQRVRELREELNRRHEERNQLRRELERARQAPAAGAPPPSSPAVERNDEEADLAPPEPITPQPVRVPVYPRDFATTIGRLPPHVARAALVAIARLAGGEASVFHDVRRLQGTRDTWRLRVGMSHRLLFRPGAGELEVIDLVHRQDLERAVRVRKRSGG